MNERETEAARLQERRDAYGQRWIDSERRAMEHGGLADTTVGRMFVQAKFIRLIDVVDADIMSWLKKFRRACRSGEVKGWLRKIPEADRRSMIAVAGVTLIEMVFKIGRVDMNLVARSVGTAVLKEKVLQQVKREHPHVWEQHMSNMVGGRKLTWHYFRRHFERRFGIPVSLDELDLRMRAHVGQAFLEAVLRNTDLFTTELNQKMNRRRRVHSIRVILPTERFHSEMEELFDHILSNMVTDYTPMFGEPDPWTAADEGGYYDRRTMLIKGKRNPEDCSTPEDCPAVYRAANIHQAVPWVLNPDVAGCLVEAWQGRGLIADLPDREPIAVPPPLHTDDWKAMPPAERRKYALVRRQKMDAESRAARERSSLYVLEKDLREYQGKSLYFPSSIDFRGRLYSTHPFGPQCHDRVRGSLMFKEGREIDSQGSMNWLKVHGANVFGIKGTFIERLKWADSVSEMVECLTKDGPEGPARGWWETSANPWQTLGWAHQMMRADAGLKVHMPVQMDGSCHGIQIWSLLLRDRSLASKVNVVDGPPADIYSELADELNAYLADKDHVYADLLREVGVTRKLVKPILMNLPFGISVLTVREMIQSEIDKRFNIPKDHHYKASSWIAPKLYRMAKVLAGSTLDGLAWVRSYAKAATQQGKYPTWTNPLGLEVMQDYRVAQRELVRLSSIGCQFRLWNTWYEKKPNKAMNTRAIAPNFIHSLDSALMMQTMLAAHDSHKIQDFSMIHDGYSVHPNDAPTLYDVVRHTAADMFSVNLLERLADECAERYGVTLDAPPIVGDLDPEEVRRSTYFFS